MKSSMINLCPRVSFFSKEEKIYYKKTISCEKSKSSQEVQRRVKQHAQTPSPQPQVYTSVSPDTISDKNILLGQLPLIFLLI